MHNAERPTKCHTQSTKSPAFFNYAHHSTGHQALQDKSIMHGVHEKTILKTYSSSFASVCMAFWQTPYTDGLIMHNVHQMAKHTQAKPHHQVFLSMHDISVGIMHQKSTNSLNCNYNRSHPRCLTASQIHLWNDFILSRYISLIQSLVLCCKGACLLTCLHFEICSVLLFRMLFPLDNVISSFSFRQRLHLSDDWLKHEHFLRILDFMRRQNFCFIFQNSFENIASFLYTAKLKDLLLLLCHFLNVVSGIPI